MNQPETVMPEQEQHDEARWSSVLNRDQSADGAFVYGVRSTRIFCRPSCPSRRPQRQNARFFTLPEDALEAGFRACKRCRPDQEKREIERVRHICRLLESDAAPTLTALGREIGLSPAHLQRDFKRVTGISPRQYAESWRLNQLKTQLQNGESVLGAMFDAGYNSSRSLYQSAPSHLGMTPATYGKGGQGARISFGIAPSPLGLLLVATTAKGVCAVTLGDSEADLEAALRREFSKAQIARDDGGIQNSLETVLRFLEGREPHLDLPLDIRATAWQGKVWRALCEIKAGETRSYAQVAQHLGEPRAVRAVARACATNPVALVVPCHRVVRGDGSLAGYRWGLERKKTLLAREKEAAKSS